MDHPHPLADPIPDHAIELRLEPFAPAPAPFTQAGSPNVRTELDRHDITVVLQAIYEWGGYRHKNPLDAIAAAKRTCK